jgi:hypothetical protein
MLRLLRVVAVVSMIPVVLSCSRSREDSGYGPGAEGATKKEVVKQTAPTSCDNLVPPPIAQFPAGFDYPQTASTLQGWVQPGGGDRMRFHAYCLFAGLNQVSNSTPTWRAWDTSTQAFPYQYNPWKASATEGEAAGSEPQTPRPVSLNAKNQANATVGVGAINNPAPIYSVNDAIINNPRYASCVQQVPNTNYYNLKDGVNFQSNGDIMVATVSYNRAALDYILGTGLYDAAKLDALLPTSATSPSTSIPPFPSTSIVLKVMLWPVNGGGSTWTAVTPLPIWDWDANKPGSSSDNQYAGYEMQNLWRRAVAISSGPVTAPEQKRVQFLYGVLDSNGNPIGPNTYNDAQLVGLDRFYSKKYTDTDLAALSDCDRAILDASAYWTYKRAFQAGDSLALIAMHIITKEQSDWTFQSAWWHPDAQACTSGVASNRFCGDRPNTVPGGDTTYKNYMMTTTYGTTQQSGNRNYYAPPGTQGAIWPVAYNPYIELAASHPITTNCMNCHHRAAWPPTTPDTKPDKGRSSTYLQTSPPNPNALEVFQSNNGVFNGLLMLDSMWAVSDRAGYPVPGQGERAKAP